MSHVAPSRDVGRMSYQQNGSRYPREVHPPRTPEARRRDHGVDATRAFDSEAALTLGIALSAGVIVGYVLGRLHVIAWVIAAFQQ